jgi:hypothetical protein
MIQFVTSKRRVTNLKQKLRIKAVGAGEAIYCTPKRIKATIVERELAIIGVLDKGRVRSGTAEIDPIETLPDRFE